MELASTARLGGEMLGRLTLIGAATACLCLASTWSVAAGGLVFTNLSLLNGWQTADGTRKPSVAITQEGIVVFKGGMQSIGSAEPLAFKLPAKFRPAKVIFVPVSLCNGAIGRLLINASGSVTVQTETNFYNALCLTSLDGVSFVK